jgi:hypothetical protein
MIVNEIAQWAVLVFLAVVSFGLLRQLGSYVAPRSEEAAREYGPSIGSALPQVLFSDEEWRTVRALVAGSRENGLALMFLDENCEACERWATVFEERGPLEGIPLVAYINGDALSLDNGFVRAADLIVKDTQREVMNDVNIRATPFLIVADQELRVEYKQVGGGPHEGVENWRRKTKRSSTPDRQEISA